MPTTRKTVAVRGQCVNMQLG